MKRSLFIFLSIIVTSILTIFIGSGCANIVPPSGGPRDTIPPVLIKAEPGDSTVNFTGNVIELSFDEFVELRDLTQNLIISPSFDKNPKISSKLNTVRIQFQEALLPNTTYTLNFGNAVRDINESNPLPNFDYTFSTGARLDTGTLKGKVLLAETGGIDSNMVVVLHNNLSDSAVNTRPPYVSKLDRNGNFTFKNLPKTTFAIYATGNVISKRYSEIEKTQLFAFRDSTVTIGSTSQVLLYAYRLEPLNNNRSTPNTNDKRLRYTTNIVSTQLDILKPFTITFEVPVTSFDSTKIALATDSTFTPVTNFTTALDTSRKKLEIRTNWQEGTRYNFITQADFAIDSLGRKLLKTDTLSFTTKRTADYGSLKLRVRNIDTTLNPVIQFVQANNVIISAPIKSGFFNAAMFLPGEYELRILYDRNNNGIWDSGQFFGIKKQPEIVLPIERKILVKAATDNDFEVSL